MKASIRAGSDLGPRQPPSRSRGSSTMPLLSHAGADLIVPAPRRLAVGGQRRLGSSAERRRSRSDAPGRVAGEPRGRKPRGAVEADGAGVGGGCHVEAGRQRRPASAGSASKSAFIQPLIYTASLSPLRDVHVQAELGAAPGCVRPSPARGGSCAGSAAARRAVDVASAERSVERARSAGDDRCPQVGSERPGVLGAEHVLDHAVVVLGDEREVWLQGQERLDSDPTEESAKTQRLAPPPTSPMKRYADVG